MTDTINIKTPDGERMDIELDRPSGVERARLMARAPDSLLVEEGERVEMSEAVVEYMLDIVTDHSVLTMDLIDELEMGQIFRLVAAGAQVLAGDDIDVPQEQTNQPGPDKVEFNDDGSVDLDDWR